MLSLLLAIIYISFISLGLPDALLGSAWPAMYKEMQVPISSAGMVSMIIAGGTIISSLNSDRFIKKIGTGKLTAISVGMTAVALWGFSTSHSFLVLCAWAIPYGLGAGSVDAALNNFVALHYKAKHMSWLHCFWGIGATLGPYLMGYFLTVGMKWNMGYFTISVIQIVLTGILILSLPLWKKNDTAFSEENEETKSLSMKELLKISGAKPTLVAFFCYCALEATTGLWGSSYLVMEKGITAETAAKWISLFYFGITFGRFLSGFLAIKLSNKNMVRIGQGVAFLGTTVLLLPLGIYGLCAGFILIGMGCAPIYPCLLHETPENFGKDLSQAIMGMQMACAYVGSTFMPPLFGLIAEHINIKLYPFYLVIFVIVMIIMVEMVNRIKNK
ncbi:fucose permease [Mobilisporobacter senegalensis]|uniref:Fucose permease n=1 Tax=Mobilisporobacter senegalensis TaxID=1329262 RepID=A0A3N1XPD1_9FIRM|nr:MFS transporter [Mobilisporobacter senegalensis]ROR28550.1 fucose permease [Mobilisporobacter senegalensis]